MNVRVRSAAKDPRPLRLEPLPLDLLNTSWIDNGQVRDLLETVSGAAVWLNSAVLDAEQVPDLVNETHRRSLCAARDRIRAIAEHPHAATARRDFNEVLAHGHRSCYLGKDGPATDLVVDKPQWVVPWLAAEAYLDLLAGMPDRIRQCQHPQCVLWYLDTSPSGTRRWCSMTLCGNRVKAGRHYQRRLK